MKRRRASNEARELIGAQQKFFAKMCVGPSATRGKGTKGMNGTARQFLTNLDIAKLNGCNEQKYRETLDCWTCTLANDFRAKGMENWGLARKLINIFLFHCTMNKQFLETFNIGHMRKFLEVPLDSKMIEYLKGESQQLKLDGCALKKYRTIKSLKCQLNNQIQAIAKKVANENECDRCDLDFFAWPAEK